ncbi:MAG: hypothetical protein KF690_11220 [Bacteroidetes bacterium]|nr:hypothetical protein [Bacteroidota bacterium]
MLEIDMTDPQSIYQVALSHLLMGLIKADGDISEKESRRVEELVEKNPGFLPLMLRARIIADVQDMIVDEQYLKWDTYKHYNRGMEYFDDYVQSGKASTEHVKQALYMISQVMEVNGVDEKEKTFYENLIEDFQQKYDVQS